MYAVMFEVKPIAECSEEYLKIAARLKKFLPQQKGFISIERFQSLVDEKKLLSLSFWEDEESISEWKKQLDHMNGQQAGRDTLFHSYRIRVANVIRDYSYDESVKERVQMPTPFCVENPPDDQF